MSLYDFKKTLPDTPFIYIFSGRESGKTATQRKRIENFINKKLGYKGTITKIELDEFKLKNKFYTKCSRRIIRRK